MAVIIGTNSYGDEAGLQDYADARGVTISGDKTQLLIKAMDWVEIQCYRFRKYEDDQALQFPRDQTFYDVDIGAVPPEVITTQYVAALLIDSGENLNPVIERAVKEEEVFQAVRVEYQDNSAEKSQYPQLTLLLKRWMSGGSGSFEVIRG